LQNYAIQKLYYSLSENINQEGLAKAALYLLGEFATLLTQPK
jgi:AP-1 complex subunit gamma-1